MLPANDIEYLNAAAPGHRISTEGGMICVVIPAFRLPVGLSVQAADLLLRLFPGYPDIPPDMWWFSPAILGPNGTAIQCTQLTEIYLGRQWQRWSRHLPPGQWRSGVDSLESYLALVRRELDAGSGRAAA
jgi:hypothetical protein